MVASNQSKLRVIVADDHELTRFSLSLALQNQDGLELAGLARDGQEAIELVRQHHPDVIILDLQMPIMDGLSASSYIKTIHPAAKILAYSSLEDPQVEVMVQTAQIDAFCHKDTSTQELVRMVRELGRQSREGFPHLSEN